MWGPLWVKSKRKVSDKETEVVMSSAMDSTDTTIENMGPEMVLDLFQEKVVSVDEKVLSTKSYEDKLLTIFGAEVSQKLQAMSMKDDLVSTSSSQMHNVEPVKEVYAGVGVEIPLSDA